MLYSTMIASVWVSLCKRLTGFSIFQRILLGNTLIICAGAVFGTLLTRHLTGIAADLWLILFFSFSGILLTLLINTLILYTSLGPLRELRHSVQHLDRKPVLLQDPCPDIADLAEALNSLILTLDERTRRLEALSQRTLSAQEEERKHIARSLHDDTAQALAMLILDLERLEQQLPPGQAQLSARLIEARLLAVSTLKELRTIIAGLRPSILDDLGLFPAIRWYARNMLEAEGVRVEVQAPDGEPPLPPELALTLFRITQEAVNNVLKHAGAGCVSIALLHKPGQVSLLIADDGSGFDVSQSAQQAVGLGRLGLLGLQERAELVGGALSIDSAPGQGTRLQVDIPLECTKSLV
jgi:two-component system, NarL family, sensor histidine kinase UhpB